LGRWTLGPEKKEKKPWRKEFGGGVEKGEKQKNNRKNTAIIQDRGKSEKRDLVLGECAKRCGVTRNQNNNEKKGDDQVW